MKKHSGFVLVVDDEAEIRNLLKSALEETYDGLRCVVSPDGADAAVKASRQRFVAAVVDIGMPKMDGISLLNSVFSLPTEFKPRKVLVLSGKADPKEVTEKFGALVEFAAKPCSTQVVVDFIGKVLQEESAGTAAAPRPVAAAPSQAAANSQGAGSSKQKFDAILVNEFVKATLEVLKTTGQIEAKRDSLFLKQDDQASGDISAIIPMNSSDFHGSMALSFEEKCFLTVVGNMLGEKYEKITPEIADAAAELCNQIYGTAKKALNEKGYSLELAIPSIVVGKGHQVRHAVNGPYVAVRFQCSAGTFLVEAGMVPKSLAKAA
ncbi:MAG: chemotaxis protein CheX [Bdellovibrionales bacterium]|nr:chemotaxis protein CheX [Bdellovibrionales bacterium]